jgi:PAS domain S-box-containing protein
MKLHRRLILQAGGFVVLTVGIFVSVAHVSRQSELAGAEQAMLDTDRLVAAQVESEFNAILSVLQHAAGRLGTRLDEGRAWGWDETVDYLAALKAGLPLVDGLFVADGDGLVRASTRLARGQSMSVADRDYFVALKVPGADPLAVSPPVANRATGHQTFVVARRLDAAAGFAGMVAAPVRPEHIGAFFAQVNTVADAKLSVVRQDGTMLFRVPAGHLGAKVATHWIRENSSSGATRFTSLLDGIERIAAYRVLPNLPLVVVVSRDVDTVLEAWSQRMAWLGAGLAALLGVVLPLWVFASLQSRQRKAALTALRDSEERLSAILAASPFPILVSRLDDGAVVLHNQRAAALLGPEGKGGLLHSDRFFTDPQERARLAARLREDGVIQDAEARLVGASGQAFWALVSAAVIRIAGEDVVLVAVNDISARKRSEDETQEALNELRRAQRRLVQSEKLASLGGLVAGVAHEVNTPLGIVVTTATFLSDCLAAFDQRVESGMLRRSDLGAFLKAQRDGIDLVVNNIQRAAQLVQSFKQVAADQASDSQRRFDLAGWLADLLSSLSPAWKRSGHRVTADCPTGIAMDSFPGMLAQIVSNLVTNSLVHGYPDGASGTIRIGASVIDADTVELVYEDDGAGIPADHLERIFDPFFTTRRNAGSTGLGLHIIHNLVTGPLHGTIAVTSPPGGGARFVIRLPRQATTAAAEAPTAPQISISAPASTT